MYRNNCGLRKNWTAGIAATAILFALPTQAQTDVDPPVTAKIGANTDIHVVAPSITFYGTRGLSQTASAEALGEGRLTFGAYGSWYQQQKTFLGAPNKNANIFTGIGSVSLGINRHMDAFASLSGFGSTDYESDSAAGMSTVGGGIQGTLPLPQKNPIRLAAQLGIYQGFSENAINQNHADGYNYFETRTGLDFMAKLIQTITLGHENTSFKLHFNEGMVTSAQDGTEALLLLSAAAQVNIFAAILGVEAHSRTPFSDISVATDPLWVTPSVQFRTPYSLNVTLGGDISLSDNRDDAAGTRALEPYRLFAGMAFSFDTEYGKRAAAKAKEQRDADERNQLQSSNRNLMKSLADQSRDDSLARLAQQSQSDSSAAAMASKSQQDSVAMAAKAYQDSVSMAGKAHQDSMALVEARMRLNEEKSKRSEAEKQLLSTGLLLLDAVYFETGKTDISINSKPYLNIIAKMLTKYPKLRIEVSGHTDNIGSEAMNTTLSQGRAQSVATYMTEVSPELQNILTAKGYAYSQPKADNKTSAGRKLNRRTELQVLNKDVLSEYNR
jgi:outer membrane protein OmpA-like peptidoglycan-associated protein